jgi:hypothetical protein
LLLLEKTYLIFRAIDNAIVVVAVVIAWFRHDDGRVGVSTNNFSTSHYYEMSLLNTKIYIQAINIVVIAVDSIPPSIYTTRNV